MNLVDKKLNDDWSIYEKSLNMSIRMRYPSTWIKKEMVAYSISYFFSETNESNVNLVVELLPPSGISLQDYANAAKEEIIQQGFEIIESVSSNFTKIPAWVINYRKEEEGMKVRGMQIMRIQNEKAILVTYTSFPEQFDRNVEKAKEMFNSLEFQSEN